MVISMYRQIFVHDFIGVIRNTWATMRRRTEGAEKALIFKYEAAGPINSCAHPVAAIIFVPQICMYKIESTIILKLTVSLIHVQRG